MRYQQMLPLAEEESYGEAGLALGHRIAMLDVVSVVTKTVAQWLHPHHRNLLAVEPVGHLHHHLRRTLLHCDCLPGQVPVPSAEAAHGAFLAVAAPLTHLDLSVMDDQVVGQAFDLLSSLP